MSYKPINFSETPMPLNFERRVDHFVDKRIHFHLAGAWDVKLEGTIDGVNWVTIQNNLVAGDVIVEVPNFWRKLRVTENISGGASAYLVTLGGLQILQ